MNLNYIDSIVAGGTRFYYLNDPYIHGPHLHRLDGPAIEFLEKTAGVYYINSVFIGNYPEDKGLYEKAVERYIKEQIFK